METIHTLNIQPLIDYYRSKGGITLVGLNDSQLIDVMNPKSKKMSFNLLAKTFAENGVQTTALNAGSSFYNKAEHARAMVEEDLTAQEIQLLNSYSFLAAYSKVLHDLKVPFTLPDGLERLMRPSLGINVEPNTRLSNLLESKPVIITSFVANNLMRSIANNPWAIESDYAFREKRPNFNYTLSKIRDPKVLESIIELTKRTYDSILSRTNGDTYGIGFFLPRGMAQTEGLSVFGEFVELYNSAYEDLCKSLGVSYVDVSSLGSSTGKINFHANPELIKDAILHKMTSNVLLEGDKTREESFIYPHPSPSRGLMGMEHRARFALEEATRDLSKDETDTVLLNTRRERETELRIAEKATNAMMKIKSRE